MKKFIKKNIKFIFGLIVGTIISGTCVYAATIICGANEVRYDNTNVAIQKDGENVTNMQDAIETLYQKALVCENGGTTVSTFTFTINGTTYTAEEGMTWNDWINSSYNTSNGLTVLYSCADKYVVKYDSRPIEKPNTVDGAIYADDEIISFDYGAYNNFTLMCGGTGTTK